MRDRTRLNKSVGSRGEKSERRERGEARWREMERQTDVGGCSPDRSARIATLK